MWNYKVNILSTDTVERFTPLTNAHYESIIKFIMGDDDEGLIEYLEQVIRALSVTQTIKWDTLNIIDKLFIIATIRSICVSPIINVTYTNSSDTDEPVPITCNVELFSVRSSINEEYLQPIICTDDEYNMKIVMHYPNRWNENKLTSYISDITIDGTRISSNGVSSDDLYKIVNQLPPQIHVKAVHARETLEESINKMTFLNLGSQDPITLIVDELLHFIKILFTENFNNFIELNYVLVKMAKLSLTDVMKMTPIDTQLYYKMFMREQKEREKQENSPGDRRSLS